uniref:Gypsy retrotransposon integrase-like protein 1 n=1 Tax=Xenopus tropicalis TaxID=8364 RepID=A0A803JHM8_XENTR
MHPCAFFSRKFSPAEVNYDIGNRELLAVKLAFEEWRHLLEGAKHLVTVYTDHKNLLYIESAKRLNPRQARWALFFSRFNFFLTFKPGSKNTKADALSRSFNSVSSDSSECTPIIPRELIIATLESDLSFLLSPLQSSAPIETPSGKWFVPEEFREQVLREVHDSKMAGHPGVAKTISLLSRHIWWPSFKQDARTFINSCPICQRSKSSHQQPQGLLNPLPIPMKPWSHISMDFIVELPPSQGKTVIWVVVDRFSKMAHFIPLPHLPSAKTLADLFITHIFKFHGFPVNIVSDRGVQFVSRFWRAFCSLVGTELSFSSAYHPQTNGQTERVNQSLEQYLRCYVSDNQSTWSELLPWAEFAYNNATHSSSGRSPFFVVYGLHPKAFSFSGSNSPVPSANSSVLRFSEIWSLVHESLSAASLAQKKAADKSRRDAPQYKVGDLVWLSTKNIKLKVPSPKLGPRFIGPYPIIAIVNPSSVRLQLPPNFKIANTFHVSLLKPAANTRHLSVPPPVLIEGQPEYEIQEFLDSRLVRGKLQYLTRWKGFGPEENSWVSVDDIKADRLRKQFHFRFPEKPG